MRKGIGERGHSKMIDGMIASISPLSAEITIVLIIASFFTSMVSATVGLGGGVLLLAIMASVMPPLVLIPVHAIVQLGSNFGRAFTHRLAIQKTIILNFTLGSLLGALVGAMTVVNLPAAMLTLSVGVFVLYSIWAPPLILKNGGPWTDRVGGSISMFLTMFFGATGPFVSALLKPKLATKSGYIGTFSSCMTVQHGLKTVAFFGTGFDPLPWVFLLVAMIITGYLGRLWRRF